MRNTCVIIGPGGIGKSPVKHVFNVNNKWDPVRMRIEGPRTKESKVGGKKIVKAEKKYADPEIYWKLRCLVKPKSLGILNKSPGEYSDDKKVYCYNHSDKNGKLHGLILLYPVRDEQYQMLVINSPQEDCDEKIQAEIYSPVLNIMLQNDMVKGVLGEFAVILLNPCDKSVEVGEVQAIEKKTEENCELRGDKRGSIDKRVNSIKDELPAWKELIQRHFALEFTDWKFPEWRYIHPEYTTKYLRDYELTDLEKQQSDSCTYDKLLDHQAALLGLARDCLHKKLQHTIIEVDKLLKDDSQIHKHAEKLKKDKKFFV